MTDVQTAQPVETTDKRTWRQRIGAEARSWAVTLLLMWLVWMTVQSLRGGVQLPDMAPDFAGTTLDGKTVQLSALRGQPTVLYFGASWCPACRITAPTIDQFARSHPQIHVVGIAAEDAADAQAYQQATQRSFAIVPETKAMRDAYPVRALPTTIVLDAAGKVVWSRQGVLLPGELNWHVP